jgi:hypothetical protein
MHCSPNSILTLSCASNKHHICEQVAALVDRLRQNFTGKSTESSRFSSRRSSKDPSRNGSPRAPPAFLPTPQQSFFNSNSSHFSGEGGRTREHSLERSAERFSAHSKPPVPRTQDWSSSNGSSSDAQQQQQQQQQHRRQHSKGALQQLLDLKLCNARRNDCSVLMQHRTLLAPGTSKCVDTIID